MSSWVKNEMAYGLDLLLSALHVLGVEIVSSSFDDLFPHERN
jgi:hypothetical protein